MKRILLSLLILQIFLPVVFIAGCVSGGKTGTLEKDNLSKENILKEKIGMQYWMMKNKSITFYYAPSIPSESFATDDTTSFVVEELIIKGSSNTDKFYKVKTMPSGKTVYLLVSILNEDYHFYETWLSTEDPKITEERLRLKEEIRKLTGISEGKTLWFTIDPYVNVRYGYRYCLKEVILESFDVGKRKIEDENVEGSTVVTLYFQKKVNSPSPLTLEVNDINRIFYTKESLADLEKRWSYGTVWAIIDRRLQIGMTEEQARCSKGEPHKINRSIGSWGKHEQWIYRGFYLYFENGKLTSWQEQ